jgi:superoxide reductase
MTTARGIYRCEVCGNVVEVLTAGAGDLVCCGATMELQEEKTTDAAIEKHVPVIEKVEGGYKVVVGTTLHPMTEEHHIEWIELIGEDKVYRQELKPGDAPEACFCTCDGWQPLYARERCNIHGLWKS